MRLWPFGRKALTGTPEVLDILRNRQYSPIPLLGGGARQRINDAFTKAQSADLPWLYFNSPAARTVIDYIVRNLCQLEPRLYEELSEAERVARPNHPAALSLRYPNEQDTRDLFIRLVETDYLIFGNAYALKFRADGFDRVALKHIPAHRVEVLADSVFTISGYRIHGDQGQFEDYSPRDVIHWRNADPIDPTIGLSPLDSLRSVISQDVALETAIVELAKSGLVSPSYIYRPLEAPEMTADTAMRLEEDMAARLRRAGERPPVLMEGMELRDVGVSPQDAQMLDTRKYATQQMAVAYGVPLGCVGLADNIKDAQSLFYSDVLPPYAEEFTKWLNKGLLVDEYGLTEYCFEFNLDEKQMGNERLKTLVTASGGPVLTRNESRSMINRPPIEGGDEIITPLNVLVGDNPRPSPQTMPVQDPNKPSQDGDHRTDEPKQLAPARPDVKGLVFPLYKQDPFHPRYRAEMARQARNIDKAAGELTRLYTRMSNVLQNPQKRSKFDTDRWVREFGDDLHKLIRHLFENEAGLYVVQLAGHDFDMTQVQHYLEESAHGMASGLVRATKRDADESSVHDAMERALGERTEVAAASIGTRMTVKARMEAAKQAPFPEHRLKQWIPDTERHASLAGAVVPLDKSFGGIEPGSEPNCKCTLSII